MASFSEIIKKKEKEWDAPDLMRGAKIVNRDKIPFSSPLVNWSTYGGVPRYRISEFFGAPGSGKSTSAIDICKNASAIFRKEYEDKLAELRQDEKKNADDIEELEEIGPKKILYVDIEHGFDAEWSMKLGINPDEIEIMQTPNITAEDILQTVDDLIQTGELGLVVLDSIPSLVPKAELEKQYGERTVAALAGLMTIFLRKIVPVLTRFKCTMILINQIRDNMSNPYAVNTPGGKAVQFYSSMRLAFQTGNPVDFLGNELPMKTENPAGYLVDVRVIKIKTGAFDRKNAKYFLMCQSGIRPDFDYAKLALERYGIIKKGGAWFTICDPVTKETLELPDPIDPEKTKPVKVNGMAKVYEFLETHTEYYQKLKRYIQADINGTSGDEDYDGEANETLQQ